MLRAFLLLALLLAHPAYADVDSLARQAEATRIELSQAEYDFAKGWRDGQALAEEYKVEGAAEDPEAREIFTQKRLEHSAKLQQLSIRVHELRTKLETEEAALDAERRKAGLVE